MSRRYWYGYNGTPGGENMVGNYTLLFGNSFFCPGGQTLCVIYAPSGGAFPSFISYNIKNYIQIAKASYSFYPVIGQRYVYTLSV